MLKKLLAIFLALLLLAGNLVACADRWDDQSVGRIPSPSRKKPVASESENESESEILLSDIVLAEDGSTQYTLVIPKYHDTFTKYAALNLIDLLKKDYGITMELVTDETPESEYEILLGLTNREESEYVGSLPDGEYLLMQKGEKIVLLGKEIQICAAVGAFVRELSVEDESTLVLNSISTEKSFETFLFPDTYRSAILMIGDGMGENHINWALKEKLLTFAAHSLPSAGTAITRSQSVIEGKIDYTDSAAAGTALATGHKTYNGVIGKDKYYNDVQNVRELADASGAKTAIISTDPITGATPAAFLCHNENRNNTAELQDYINYLKTQNLIEYCQGEVGDNLTEATRKALSIISADDSAFFMMVEEAYTDKGGHNNSSQEVIDAVARLNDAIIYAIAFVFCHPDTVLIITADHETGGIKPHPVYPNSFWFTSTTHTNVDVPVYAIGAGTEIFNGVRTENTDIAKFIAKAFTDEKFGS